MCPGAAGAAVGDWSLLSSLESESCPWCMLGTPEVVIFGTTWQPARLAVYARGKCFGMVPRARCLPCCMHLVSCAPASRSSSWIKHSIGYALPKRRISTVYELICVLAALV